MENGVTIMQKLILATLAAASLIVVVTAPASAGYCKQVIINGRVTTVCSNTP